LIYGLYLLLELARSLPFFIFRRRTLFIHLFIHADVAVAVRFRCIEITVTNSIQVVIRNIEMKGSMTGIASVIFIVIVIVIGLLQLFICCLFAFVLFREKYYEMIGEKRILIL
jgi:nicotinamide riboside transporter PnuC